MKKITHIITSLKSQGAQQMLLNLIENMNRIENEIQVISLMTKDEIGVELEKLNIKVYEINMGKGKIRFSDIKNICRICKDSDIIQTWMYHSDFIGFIIGKLILRKKVIWGIHHSNLEKDKNKKSTLYIAKINSFLSRYVDKVVCCSKVALDNHIKYGYYNKNMVYIPNGFDIEKYKLNSSINRSNIFTIGWIGRWHPLKDIPNFLDSLEILKNNKNSFNVIMCGEKIDNSNDELVSEINSRKLSGNIELKGRCSEINNVLNNVDCVVSSSSGEAFSLVIAEAMLCEKICIVTDVGDSKDIVGENGFIVERKNPQELYKAIEKLIYLDGKEYLGKKGRESIIKRFNIKDIVNQYENLYKM